jgi:ADP-heptose:LPS heptosyltransferase
MLQVPDSPIDTSRTDVAQAVVRLLDEFEASDFRGAERLLYALQRQGRTVSGYPKVRAVDCERVTRALRAAFEANMPSFVTGDDAVARRFETILDAFVKTDVRFYPTELMRAQILQAEARLMLNDPAGARRLVGYFADRPYKIESDHADMAAIMRLDCRARAMAGDVEGLSQLATDRVLTLARIKPSGIFGFVSDFAEFIGLDRPQSFGRGVLARLLHGAATVVMRARRGRGTLLRRLWTATVARILLTWAGLLLFLLRYGDIRWSRYPPNEGGMSSRDIVVTRAMGGIGDLFMMTPGLRALSKRYSLKVKLAIDRKFFSIFENNPHVELLDIDGPPIDVTKCRSWFNLTACPAGRHEALTRPFVKKGRVELFAKGMGIGKLGLVRYGWQIEAFLDDRQRAFRQAFIARAGFSRRPIIGVQPYSRDAYKDHPNIGEFVAALSRRFDVVLFHHLADGLPEGKGIVSTVGLSLSQSISLVSALDAMVCVDSGFLHAAAAFDIPVVALFGPTDGRLFTRHHQHATVITAHQTFPCAPCWRNEDMPCQVTNQRGLSPCIASLSFSDVHAAVDAVLSERKNSSLGNQKFIS